MTPADQHKWRFPRVYEDWKRLGPACGFLGCTALSYVLYRAIRDRPAEFDTGFQDQLVELGACARARLKVGSKGARECWDTWQSVEDMRWLLYALGYAQDLLVFGEGAAGQRAAVQPKFYRRQP